MIDKAKQLDVWFNHLSFMQYFWRKKAEPMLVGIHTNEICRRIDKAIYDFDHGISTYLIITVPYRHGKSDIVSRYLPAHFIGAHPDCDVMLVTYASSLAQEFSAFSRDIASSEEYQEVFRRNYSTGTADSWHVTGGSGTVTASGLTSGITGKGYHLGVLDDFCAGRAEAESDSQREKAWQGFTNDFFTRQAPVSITIVLATPWHVDDIIGRIKARNDENNQAYDPAFQKFDVISFPAMDGEVEVWDDELHAMVTKKYDYLFPERFKPEWYKRQMSSLGTYGTASLLQCNPQVRGGNMIDTSKVNIIDSLENFPQIKYYRVWDLAHTAKQRTKDDPDYTSGTLLAYQKVDGDLYRLWIKDVARIRGSAPERDNFIRSVTEKDGNSVTVAIEISADSRDAIATLQRILQGRRIVKGVQTKGDKVARMSPVEPIFDAGNVFIHRGDWNYDWLKEVGEFPQGKHDDQIDNMSAGYIIATQSQGKMQQIGVAGL